MLRTVDARPDSFPLSQPFRISRGVKSVAEVVTVEISAHGFTGRGEGVPYPRYGETVESALAQIESVRPALEQGLDRQALLGALPPSAARNAVDCALWDLESQIAGQSVTHRLSRPKITPVPTALTISLDTPEAMAEAAAKVVHVPLLKIKVDAERPADQIFAVRQMAPNPRIIVDPNESWSIEDVADLQSLLSDLRIDLLEQPLPSEADAELEGFKSRIAIAADESAHVAGDVAALSRKYQVINIKLDKSGGLTAALQLADAAEAAGMTLMTGCMISSSLSIAPAMILAARSAFVDLDGPLWLKQDRAGGVTEEAGILHPAQESFWGKL